ncbi:MAG TPA: group II truncated hemoglobin [Acidimicrobiia bacterium]|jgi:hemoglobin|nr:group II truncated hemoglobin [Acidimicrobiia bacterium]
MLPDPPSDAAHPWGDADSPYEGMGGDAAVRRLADLFYDQVDAAAPTLRAMLPRNDATSRQKLYEFLSGWLGGPNLYMEKRGHPRLRMRHFPFEIGRDEVIDWLRCMAAALDELGVDGQLRAYLDVQFTRSALWMQNK